MRKEEGVFLVMRYLITLFLVISFVFILSGCTKTEQPPTNLVKNGNFDSGDISPWQTWTINIKDYNIYYVNADEHYLKWYRANSLNDGGLVGAIQNLGNYNISGKTKVCLSFDIRIDNQTLPSDGSYCGEYPAAVQLVFIDGSGNEYVYAKYFILEGSTINYTQNDITTIPKNTWYHFEIDLMKNTNIASNITTHPYIKEIRFYGNGWDFQAVQTTLV